MSYYVLLDNGNVHRFRSPVSGIVLERQHGTPDKCEV